MAPAVLPVIAVLVLLPQSGPGPRAAPAPNLKVGDPAPPLTIAKWIKGEPIAGFAPGKVHIVEFWATWCGPCVANIGHLTSLQRQFAQRGLIVIGVTKGDEQNTLEGCERMVAMRGRGMDYRVAFDEDGKTWAAYMEASGREGIPVSFVIDRAGKLAFLGHPNDLDQVVPAVLEGTWDPVKGPAEVREARSVLARVVEGVESDPAAALEAWRELERRWPAYASRHLETRYKALLASGAGKEAARCAEAVLELTRSTQDCIRLHIFAWRIAVQPPEGVEPDLGLALRLARIAVSMSGEMEGEALRTLSKVLWMRGESEEAVAVYEKAIAVADARLRDMLVSDREGFFEGK